MVKILCLQFIFSIHRSVKPSLVLVLNKAIQYCNQIALESTGCYIVEAKVASICYRMCVSNLSSKSNADYNHAK